MIVVVKQHDLTLKEPCHPKQGGVSINVKQILSANKRDYLSVSYVDFETIWIEIDNPKSRNILCRCAYQNLLTTCRIAYPLLLKKIVYIQIVYIFLNNTTNSDIISGNLLCMISDHLPPFAIRKCNAPYYKNMSYFAHDYRQFDERNCMSDFPEFDVSYLNDGNTDLDTKFDTFLLNLHILIEKHCPEKKLKKKMMKLREKPGKNFQILKMTKIRDKLFRQFKVPNSSTAFKVDKQFRNRVVKSERLKIIITNSTFLKTKAI